MIPFMAPMMMGQGGAVIGPTVWDPAFNTLMTYSNGNRSVRGINSNDYVVRGTQSRSTGKLVFEVTHSTSDGISGIVNSAASSTSYPGQNSSSVGYGYTVLFDKGATSGGKPAVAANDIIMAAVDFVANTVTFYKNSVALATATLPAGPLYPACDPNNSALTMTLNTGQSAFSNAVPSGFLPWG